METLWHKIQYIFQEIVNFLFPRNELEATILSHTKDELLSRIPKAKPLRGNIEAIFSYKDPLGKHFIWLLKYKREENTLQKAADIISDVLLHRADEVLPSPASSNLLLVPLPLSHRRLKERGYNQMELVAEKIMEGRAKEFLEYRPHVLQKVLDTLPQTETRSREERLKNIVDCFAVSRPEFVSGRDVILIDDVVTTGATLNEARKTLLDAGAKSVFCVALAH